MYTKSNYVKKGMFFLSLLLLSVAGFSQNVQDSEIRKNVTGISNPLESLLQLEPKVFEYNREGFKKLSLPEGKQYGFLAENVQAVFPELVRYKNQSYAVGKNSYRTARIKSVDMESLIPILIASIKEQQVTIEQLKAEIQSLKNRTNP